VLRSVAAVLAGYVSIGVLVVLTDALVWAIRPGEYISGQAPPVYYYVISLFTVPLYTVLGGCLCAWIAKAKPWKHVLALVIFGEIMGVLSIAASWGKAPLWYGLALLVLYPPAIWFGGLLRLRRPAQPSVSAAA